jgi:FixJ family two-component response regulator
MLRMIGDAHSCHRGNPVAAELVACTVRGRVTSDDPLIVVIDDDEALCRAVVRVLSTAAYQVRTYTRAADFLAEADVIEASCVLADIRMPHFDGIQLARALRAAEIDAPLIFMTATDDVDTVVTAMKLGAHDLLAKPFTGAALLGAIEAALRTGQQTLDGHRSLVAMWRLAGQLTPREAEVCALVAAGLPNKNVAARIGTTEKTVKVHRGRVMHKFGVPSLAALIRMVDRLVTEPHRDSVHVDGIDVPCPPTVGIVIRTLEQYRRPSIDAPTENVIRM